MKTWVRKTLSVGVLAAGAILFAPQSAQAADQVSVGNNGILNGNQVSVPVQVPINVCGNGVGALIGLGVGSGVCVNGAWNDVDNGGNHHGHKGKGPKGHHGYGYGEESTRTEATQISAGNAGILNGNQIYIPIQVPINICGNGVAVLGLGFGTAFCANGAWNDVESARTEASQISVGNNGIANGNQVYVPIQVPINICGNGVGALIGLGFGSAFCANGAWNDVESARTEGREELTQVSAGNNGILNGNQIAIPIQVPVNVCGNGVGALLGIGIGSAACVNGAWNDIDDEPNGHGGPHYKGSKGHGKGHGKKVARDTEFLPLGALGGLTGGLTGGMGGNGASALGASPLSALGSLPVVGGLTGGLQSSQVDAAGLDVLSLLG